jgi:myo-inositol-1(or 4)-monophosphatase
MKQEYQEIINACQKGGEILNKYFGQVLEITEKTTPADFKTKADYESEEIIIKYLKTYFPDHNIVAEESGRKNVNSEYTLIIDPLDGTNNFVLGFPYFSTTAALQKNNQVIFSVIHNPVLNRTYWAEKGQGAYLNNKKIRVSPEFNINKATVASLLSYSLQGSEYQYQTIKSLIQVLKVKRDIYNWCPTLDFCLLAEGKIEAIINNQTELHDYAAGKLIAREAGAIITEFSGQEEADENNDQFIICNSKEIQSEILKILKQNQDL